MPATNIHPVCFGYPLSGVRRELGEPAGERASGVWIPGALLVDLAGEERKRRIGAPEADSLGREVVPVRRGALTHRPLRKGR